MLYLVLILLFLVLWLITNAVCGFWLGYRSGSTHEVSTIPRASDDEQTPPTPEYATVILSTNGRNDLDTEEPIITQLLPTMSLCILDYYSL